MRGLIAVSVCLVALTWAFVLWPAPAARLEPLGLETPGWREVDWPFLRDGWPRGRAFRCSADSCGVEISLYARIKNGFCDCARGVADDDEIDHVGDVDLVTSDFVPLNAGEPVSIVGMTGRRRIYVQSPAASPRHILTVAGGRNCDAFVATAVSDGAFPPRALDAVNAFINAPVMARWVRRTQDGG